METISRLFLEKNCPIAFNEILANQKKLETQENDNFEKAVLNACSFFDLISQSNEGFLTLQGYFIKAALLLDRD